MKSNFASTRNAGFTLIEVLLVIAILAILAAVVIIALNPGKQLAEAQNAQRRSDVRAILDAMHQYSVDNNGSRMVDLPISDSCADDGVWICKYGSSCQGGLVLDTLTENEKYLIAMPADPTGASDVNTGYKIVRTAGGRVGVCAPHASGDAVISITQ